MVLHDKSCMSDSNQPHFEAFLRQPCFSNMDSNGLRSPSQRVKRNCDAVVA
jgi:hypothetical protein